MKPGFGGGNKSFAQDTLGFKQLKVTQLLPSACLRPHALPLWHPPLAQSAVAGVEGPFSRKGGKGVAGQVPQKACFRLSLVASGPASGHYKNPSTNTLSNGR